jgi:hypothetical protein
MSARHDEFASVLLARKVVSAEQLVEACWRASKWCCPLDEALLRLGYASGDQIGEARAFWFGLRFLDLTEMTIPPAIIELMPESVARENVVLPIASHPGALTVVIATLDPDVLQKLAFILNKEIRPALSTREQIVEAINRHYGPYETESVDSMLAEFTDTAIDFTQTESAECQIDLKLARDEPPALDDAPATEPDASPTAPRPTQRRATVRYYSRMNPERLFPLLVILSRAEIEAVVKRGVRQAQSEAFTVSEGSLVEIEPVLPGCACHPPREQVRVTGGEVSVTFWVVPQVLGRVMQARVVVRQDGDVLAEVPLEIAVVKQSLTRLMGALSLVLPFALFVLKLFGLDFESQQEEGFGLYAQAAGWLVQHVTPEVLTGLLLAATVGLYFWLRPRRREVFWDVKTREPASAPTPALCPAPAKVIDVEGTLSRAKQALARGDEREGERLLAEVLSAKPLHTEALLCLAQQRERGEKYAMALVLYERVLATGRSMAKVYFRASLAAHHSGDTARALSILKRAEAELPAGEMKGPLWYNMGCFAARLGRFPDALCYLNRAIDCGYDDLEKFRADPDLEPLRWHAGFRHLLAEVSNNRAWRS